MTASWADLFTRGADYDVDLEAVRTAADELSTEAEPNPAEGDDA